MVGKDILIDADALVALAKSDDANHKKALKISKRLQRRQVSWYVSPFVIGEAATVISYKVSHLAAKKFLKEVRSLELSEFPYREDQVKSADSWFLKLNKKRTSYFDCYNMSLLERYAKTLTHIFSFDRVYKRNGFKTAEELV